MFDIEKLQRDYEKWSKLEERYPGVLDVVGFQPMSWRERLWLWIRGKFTRR